MGYFAVPMGSTPSETTPSVGGLPQREMPSPGPVRQFVPGTPESPMEFPRVSPVVPLERPDLPRGPRARVPVAYYRVAEIPGSDLLVM